MPITIAFTITGLVALFIHSIYLRRVYLNQQAQHHAKINGDRKRIVDAFFSMEVTRSVINLIFVASGIGILSGHRWFGFLLALPPLLSIVASSFALKGIR